MKILALDTSSRFGSLALCDDDHLLAEYTTAGVINQSERLLATVQRLLDDIGWKINDVDGFAAVHGPGSFTGIRVGLATVQGLAMATSRPAIGISSLHALALGNRLSRLPICPVMDARRDEVYAAVFRSTGSALEVIEPEQAVEPESFLRRLEGPTLFIGDAVPVVRGMVARFPSIQPEYLEGSSRLCRASVIAAWAAAELSKGPPGPAHQLRPRYLRASEAELKLRRAESLARGPSDLSEVAPPRI